MHSQEVDCLHRLGLGEVHANGQVVLYFALAVDLTDEVGGADGQGIFTGQVEEDPLLPAPHLQREEQSARGAAGFDPSTGSGQRQVLLVGVEGQERLMDGERFAVALRGGDRQQIQQGQVATLLLVAENGVAPAFGDGVGVGEVDGTGPEV